MEYHCRSFPFLSRYTIFKKTGLTLYEYLIFPPGRMKCPTGWRAPRAPAETRPCPSTIRKPLRRRGPPPRHPHRPPGRPRPPWSSAGALPCVRRRTPSPGRCRQDQHQRGETVKYETVKAHTKTEHARPMLSRSLQSCLLYTSDAADE